MKQFLLPILIFLGVNFSFSQTYSSEKLTNEVEQYMKASVAHDYFSGSILIAKEGKILFSKGYGMANYELQVPNDKNTVFLIGSLTKQFTSMAIMQLAEQGKLKINDSFCDYIENCPEAWRSITIKNLLTHTSGIFNVSKLPDWDEKHCIQPYTSLEVINLVKDIPLQFSAGNKFKYSNTNYILLGLIIEKVSGKTYSEYLEEKIIKPVGMNSTVVFDPLTIILNKANGYYTNLNSFINAPYENISLKSSSGTLFSTVEDLLLWEQALYTDKLLSRKGIEEIFTPVKDNYGYGWEIRDKFGKITHGHSGSLNGFSSYLLRFPTENITIIVLSNSNEANATKVAHQLSSIFFEKPYKIPTAQPYEKLSKAYTTKGIESAIEEYQKIKKDYSAETNEELLNDFGYGLLKSKKHKDAIQVFILNVNEHPKSPNVYDSLAEAYFKDKNQEQALFYYKKVLEVDPASESAKRAIKRILEQKK